MSSADEAVAYAKSLHNWLPGLEYATAICKRVHSEWTLMFLLNQKGLKL